MDHEPNSFHIHAKFVQKLMFLEAQEKIIEEKKDHNTQYNTALLKLKTIRRVVNGKKND